MNHTFVEPAWVALMTAHDSLEPPFSASGGQLAVATLDTSQTSEFITGQALVDAMSEARGHAPVNVVTGPPPHQIPSPAVGTAASWGWDNLAPYPARTPSAEGTRHAPVSVGSVPGPPIPPMPSRSVVSSCGSTAACWAMPPLPVPAPTSSGSSALGIPEPEPESR